ncbi:MAG: hypothetical protein ACMG55_06210, partial [Microcoleus sp.]
RRFFWGILLFFIFESLWLVFSVIYPGAFDEAFHFGIIKIFANQWSPFFSHLPRGAEAFGAINHDPSYLYHYLMSFPYRLSSVFTHDQTTLVILLRLINVALFSTSLVLFRRFMLRAHLSKPLTHLSLLVFALLPIVPLLAAQINYDNLLVLLIAGLLLLVQSAISSVQSRQLPLSTLLYIFILCLLASIVKYAFLPIFAALFVFFVGYLIISFRNRAFITALRKNWGETSRRNILLLSTLLLISGGLFCERYGVNLVVYKTPVPDCAKVLGNEACLQYGPWNRDYYLAQAKADSPDTGPTSYVATWMYGIWYRTFFSINGDSTDMTRYLSYPPMPIIGFGAIALFIVALSMLLVRAKHIFYKQPLNICLGFIILCYTGVLFYQNYHMYLQTGQAVAINGRYLLLIAIPIVMLLAQAASSWLRGFEKTKLLLATLTILIFLQGGGFLSFIAHSQDGWYWPNQEVQAANKTAQQFVRSFTLDYPISPDWLTSP